MIQTLLRVSISKNAQTIIRIGEYSFDYNKYVTDKILCPYDATLVFHQDYPSQQILIEIVEAIVKLPAVISIVDDNIIIDTDSLATNRYYFIMIMNMIMGKTIKNEVKVTTYAGNCKIEEKSILHDNMLQYITSVYDTDVKTAWSCCII